MNRFAPVRPRRDSGRPPLPSAPVGPPAPLAIALLAALLAPGGAAAQFGPIEALASRVSDLSFYYGTGGITSGSAALAPNPWGVTSFGVEMLFEVARVPSGAARARLAEAGPVERRVLERIEVRQGPDRADTIYHYDVVRVQPSYADDEILWTMEVGIGYGQTEGLRLRDPELEMTAMLRNLPAVTVYVSYEPLGTYVGLRTGLMRTESLQVIDAAGTVYRGRGEAFQMGVLAGYALAVRPTYLFLETGYLLRTFPSVEWTAPGPLPPGIPRRLDASGWTLVAGIQFPVR
jgi:hypothetical protein